MANLLNTQRKNFRNVFSKEMGNIAICLKTFSRGTVFEQD